MVVESDAIRTRMRDITFALIGRGEVLT